MAEQLKGGVIMDVVTPEQAKIAEDAGAVAVMALERVPADIRKDGGVARMSDPDMIEGIISAVSIPVMAKSRIGHFVEAQVLQSLGVDYIDESEVLTPADEVNHSDKWAFTTPFVCGATNLGEALRRIAEGAAMIRSKGEAGTGNVVEAVRHLRQIKNEIARLRGYDNNELYAAAKELRAPYEIVKEVAELGKLPVVLFSAGGVATPADAALMRQLGAEGVFVGSGIFKSGDPAKRAAAIVKATTFYDDPKIIADASRNLGEAMVGINCDTLPRPSATPTAAGKAPTPMNTPVIGVLALQGDVREHLIALAAADAVAREVRRPEELAEVDGLVIPGGESTTISKLAHLFGMMEPLRARVRGGMPVYGTCAGMIMLADKILDPRSGQETIGGIDMIVRRNAFGRQNESFEATVDVKGVGAILSRASSSAPPGSSPWVPRPRCSPSTAATSSPYARATRSPRRSTRN